MLWSQEKEQRRSLRGVVPTMDAPATRDGIVVGRSSLDVLQADEGQSDREEAMEAEQWITTPSRFDSKRGVHILTLSGEPVLEISRQEAAQLTIQELKERVSHVTEYAPDYHTFVAEGQVAEDSCRLSDSAAASDIYVIIEHAERGPFALGQEASWGVWENMSTNSAQLSRFDGCWELIIDTSVRGPWQVPFVHSQGWLRSLKICEGIVTINANSSVVVRLRVHETQVSLSDCVLGMRGHELHLTSRLGNEFRYRLASAA